jgi:hypothetical protein
MAKLEMTPNLISAAATDAANRAMRKAGRDAWSVEDYDVAAELSVRLSIQHGFAPIEAYADCGFGEYPIAA